MTAFTALIALVGALAGCGETVEAVGPPEFLSPAAQAGWTTAEANGCMSCHGRDGAGGTGPSWIGVAGATRTLLDGTEVTADRDYLVRSLLDPQAERVEGYQILMPAPALTQQDVDSIIAYLEELS